MVLAGNLISFLGCTLMILIGFIKNKDRILTAQCGQFSLQALSNLLLGSVPGTISCVLGVVRIVVFRYVRVTAALKIGFLALQAALTMAFGATTFVQWIPFLSMVLYTWYLDTDNAVLFKLVNIFGVTLFAFHDLHYLNFVAFGFDIFTMISTLIGIVLILREKAKNNTSEKK